VKAVINKILQILPVKIIRAIEKENIKFECIEEIRIRRKRQSYLVINGKNILLNVILNDNEMNNLLKLLTNDSLYAYKDTISKGYLILDTGFRIGLIGSGSTENGSIIGIYNVSEFSFRIQRKLRIPCEEILPLAKSSSLLIYSPPGEGKTTLLRELIIQLSQGNEAKRTCVIDTRDELAFGLDDGALLVSILSGYPRSKGIEISIRTMNAQILVCDEIGDIDDAHAIIEAQDAGAPLIATCHGKSIGDILSHLGMLKLHKS
jgi:stage III sporulation protein AA